MRIILTRHGETEENKRGVLQGHLQGKLSEKGKQQAKLISNRLKGIKTDVIITSDLKRCSDTAKEIEKYHKDAEFIKEPMIRERNLGEFQGKKVTDSDWDKLPGDVCTNRPEVGETFYEVWDRLKDFYKNLLENHPHETILIVGHGGSQKLLQGMIQNTELKQAIDEQHLENTGISEFEVDTEGNFKTITINCKEHLD